MFNHIEDSHVTGEQNAKATKSTSAVKPLSAISFTVAIPGIGISIIGKQCHELSYLYIQGVTIMGVKRKREFQVIFLT